MFVVEVARGADSGAPSQLTQLAKERVIHNTSECIEIQQIVTNGYVSSASKSNERVLVHPPPASSLTNHENDDVLIVDEDGAVSMSSPSLGVPDAFRDAVQTAAINTGLSQSDLSISSSTGSNQAYCYGSQEAYTIQSKGYQSSSPHQSHIEIIATPLSVDTNTVALAVAAATTSAVVEPTSATEDVEPEFVQSKDGNHDVLAGESKTSESIISEEPSIPEPVNRGLRSPGLLHIANGEIDRAANESVTDADIVPSNNVNEDDDNFDSLMNLPDPPSSDEIKQLHDITLLESNNFDSLPPPPPDTLIEASIINGQS